MESHTTKTTLCGPPDWILNFDAVTCAIPDGKRPEQVAENCKASDLPPLSEDVMRKVKGIYEERVKGLVHQRW